MTSEEPRPMFDNRGKYLPTYPGTLVEFSVTTRARPCWRCRFHFRLPPWRRHWQCRKPPRIIYLDSKPRRRP